MTSAAEETYSQINTHTHIKRERAIHFLKTNEIKKTLSKRRNEWDCMLSDWKVRPHFFRLLTYIHMKFVFSLPLSFSTSVSLPELLLLHSNVLSDFSLVYLPALLFAIFLHSVLRMFSGSVLLVLLLWPWLCGCCVFRLIGVRVGKATWLSPRDIKMCQHKSIAVTATTANSSRAQRKTSTQNFLFCICSKLVVFVRREKKKNKYKKWNVQRKRLERWWGEREGEKDRKKEMNANKKNNVR